MGRVPGPGLRCFEGEGKLMQRGVHHCGNPDQGTQVGAGTSTFHVHLKLQTAKPWSSCGRCLLDDPIAESPSQFLQSIGVVAGHVRQDFELW